jgi:hypothetical protein
MSYYQANSCAATNSLFDWLDYGTELRVNEKERDFLLTAP